MGRFMKAELVGAKTVQGPAEEKNYLYLSFSLSSRVDNDNDDDDYNDNDSLS